MSETIRSLSTWNPYCAAYKYNWKRIISANLALRYVIAYRGRIEMRSCLNQEYQYSRYAVLLDIHDREIAMVGKPRIQNVRLSEDSINSGRYNNYIKLLYNDV